MLARSRILVLAFVVAGCAATVRRFPARPVETRAGDFRPWGPPPRPRAQPPSTCFLPGNGREAANTNAVDEVPDSTWYTNRALSAAEAARGACGEPADDTGPWWVVGLRGRESLEIEIAGRGLFVLEADEPGEPERATAAEAIASRVYYAAGYRVPCARVVYLTPSVLRPGPGFPRALDRAVTSVLRRAVRGPGGTLRAVLREMPPGDPLGPFSYGGTWQDDPNDVVPHEDRRELRASALVAALTANLDPGEGTLDVFRRTGRQVGIVEHYLVGFRRAFAGIYDAARFAPEDFRPANPAMSAMTELDAHWMARKLTLLGDPQLRAIVREGLLSDPRDAKFLIRTLRARRRALLERYLMTWTPVARPRIERQDLCFDDLATRAGLTMPLLRPMSHRVTLNGRRLHVASDRTGTVCARVPSGRRGDLVVRIEGRPSDEARFLRPVAVHLHRFANGSLAVAGVER